MIEIKEILNKIPDKNCGSCGEKNCTDFKDFVTKNPDEFYKCPYILKNDLKEKHDADNLDANNPAYSKFTSDKSITWKDNLGRDYDFILDKFPGESGPRETMLPFNPTIVEKLGLKKGDVIYGRPAWISCGCPVTHAGIIIEEPDYFNGTVVWCIVGPMLARQKGINIGYYNTTAYEGIVNTNRTELVIGKRYYFQPRYCMLQWRHCGLVNSLGKTKDGLRVRVEGLWIG